MNNTWIRCCVGIWLLLACMACSTARPYVAHHYQEQPEGEPPAASERAYQVFLIGDVGAPSLKTTEPALKLLKARLEEAGENSAVVFLGDNIYCCGLPDSSDARRERAERRLVEVLHTVADFKGRVVFIPGNHDWNDSRPGGLEAVNRQEQFIEAHLSRGNVFLPDSGFPGPAEVELTDQITLVALDTEWWLTEEEKPFGDTGAYELDEAGDFLLQLDDAIKRNQEKDLLVVGHHPLFSNGPHGGHFPLRQHLFPLTAAYDKAYLPLPVLGSAYPLYHRYIGGRQDLAHPRYKQLRHALTNIFEQHDGLIYAAGHAHSLQYFEQGQQHYLVSGGGSRTRFVAQGHGAAFTYGGTGFMALNYYQDGAIWMEAWEPTASGANGKLLFRTQLKAPSPEQALPAMSANGERRYPEYRDSTVVAAANPDYAAGPVRELFLGRHRRSAWATPVAAPMLDLGRDAGGLAPIKRGGSAQTNSLRLQGADGKEYVLRLIDKDPTRSLPKELQGSIVQDVRQDQVSAMHPYSAFIVPKLADAAGVYHTNPRLVYVPRNPRLGIYQDVFAGQLALLEERPNDDVSDKPNFGGSEEAMSARKLLHKINSDNDHRVDQQAFARARLFDMLLADWDRHPDQWRWAAFEPADSVGKLYRPIPRDRDFAFFKMNGLFPTVAKRFFLKEYQDFRRDYGNLKGLTQNGLPQDRRFTNALTRSDWIEIADSVRSALTDAVIEDAVHGWPEGIFALHGKEIIDILKARRDRLPEIAGKYYDLNAKVVDVVGSDKHERFEVERRGDGQTRVAVYKTSKEGEVRREIYRRTFRQKETKEIRLYGLGGRDEFVVSGGAEEGVRVIAVGGPGEDAFADRSHVQGSGKKTRFYDTVGGASWGPGAEAKMIRSDDPTVNSYNPSDFKYNQSGPLLFFERNPDDGLFVGGGAYVVRHGFRKQPYAALHKLRANVAARTQAFNADYQGRYTAVRGDWDAGLNLRLLAPNNVRNFYGLGNETENAERDAAFYQARLTRLEVLPAFIKQVEEGAQITIGPSLEYTRVEEDDNRFIGQPQAGVSPHTFDDQIFLGLDAAITLASVDNAVNPKQGFRWTITADINQGVRSTSDSYSTLSSALSVYLSPVLFPQVTLALRAGGAHNIGAFPFYGARTLGGKDNLRGYRSTRFAGRTSVYQNAELRMKLFDFSTYVVRGEAGLLGFFDNGRVWADEEDSRVWHQGYGAGLWVSPFDQFVMTTALGFSEEARTFTVGMGFFY